MNARDTLAALAVAVAWGLNFIAIKVGVGETSPLVLAGLRFLFTAIPLVFFIAPPKAPAGAVVLYGLLVGTCQFGALFIAMARGFPVGLASLVIQAQVFFTILLAAIVLREHPHRPQVIAAVIGFAGMAVIASERLEGADLGPFLLVILAALFWGFGNLLAKSLGKVDALALTVWSSLVAAPPLFALSLLTEGDSGFVALAHPSLRLIASVLTISYLGTVFAFAVWAWLLTRHAAASVTPFALLVPVIGMIAGAILYGERLTALEVIGGALVMLGLAINVFAGWARRRARSQRARLG